MTTIAPTASELARAATWYARHGWHVFPLAPGTKDRPVVKDWEHAATTDLDQIAAWWSRGPCNIGIACGPSGLYVVDLDVPRNQGDRPPAPWNAEPGVHDGSDVLALRAVEAGTVFPHGTHCVGTASGGLHLYFTQPEGLALRNTTGHLGWKIDGRGHGGYVVAAGSVVNGSRYSTLNSAPPQPLPVWIAAALAAPKPRRASGATEFDGRSVGDAYAHAALRAELDNVLSAVEGTRNHTLNTAAFALGQLVATGLLDRGQVEAALIVAAIHIGLTQAEAERTINSGLTAGAHHPRRTA